MIVMTSDDSLSLILRRLDEIERKLDRMMEELETRTAIGLFGSQGQSSKEGLNYRGLGHRPRSVPIRRAPAQASFVEPGLPGPIRQAGKPAGGRYVGA